MTLVAGRATGLRVSNWGRAGNSAQVQGFISGSDVYEVDARRQQLLGMVDNPDENVFPVTWTVDPNVDGFYRVRGVQVGRIGVERNLKAAFALDLERVPGFARPAFESVFTGLVRTNDYSVTAPVGIGVSLGPYTDLDNPPGTATSITTDDGTAYVIAWTYPQSTPYSTLAFWPAASYYVGGVKIEVKYGSTWYPIVGQQIPVSVGGNWRISNGLTRVYPSKPGTYYGFKVERYRASTGWTGQDFEKVSYYTTSAAWTSSNMTGNSSGYQDPQILTNSPEVCTVRIPPVGTDALTSRYTDFTLRAGDPFVCISSPLKPYLVVGVTSIGIGRVTAEAANSFSGGVRASADDANSNRYLITTTQSGQQDTVNGRRTAEDTTVQFDFAVSPDYQTGPITGATSVRDCFYAGRYERRRVVAR